MDPLSVGTPSLMSSSDLPLIISLFLVLLLYTPVVYVAIKDWNIYKSPFAIAPFAVGILFLIDATKNFVQLQ